jgi:hypothetical protein
MMIPETVNSATASVEVELDHHCPHCHTVSAAKVQGKGVGIERRFFFELGGSDAQFLAETEAQRDAARLIRVARCPRCQLRDGAEVRKLWLPLLWTALVVLALAWLAPHARIPLAVLLPLLELLLGRRAVRALRGSDRRVQFIGTVELGRHRG